ncbi:MAG: hypothetical protein JWL85_1048 [Candidatus Saccharibacteria bacterium]|nr:hypothetical protein [Candidatus Saccharibacteria bacterium]
MGGMSEQEKRELPYKSLGNQLKRMRQKLQETLIEVSGAVEIDVDALSNYERGSSRPSEDILLLLISHFAIKEEEATKLWEMAGYGQLSSLSSHATNDEDLKSNVMVMPMDARIVYTDMVHVMVNNYGVVMNFMQGAGPNNQPLAVARIGMSKEHAKSVLEVLQKTLAVEQPKMLPAPPENKKDK